MPKKSEKPVLPDDEVKLKPIMGIRPGHYLACLYGVVLLVILFFILLYPGISNPGSIVIVKSEPWGAAVLVDGVYKDSSPCEIFVSRGHHEIELHLPGFLPMQIDKEIGGRLFASALFPLKTEISLKLDPPNPAEALINEAAEYAAWTFTGEPSVAYQVPLSLSEGVYRLGPSASDTAVRKSMEDTIAASARFAVTRAGLRDLIRAKLLLDNQGLSPSPLSLLSSTNDIIDFLSDNPQAALWLGELLTDDSQSTLTSSLWFEEAAGLTSVMENSESSLSDVSVQSGSSIQAGGLMFRMIGGGQPLLGHNFPPGTTVETFYICETVITPAAWEAFLEQQPKWKKENTETLIKEGLVNEDYLETVPSAPSEGVSGISWYAATAFCQWLNASINVSMPQQYGSSGAALELRLPTEAEWEYAAKAHEYLGPLEFNSGRFWEWCLEPFVPLNFLQIPSSAAQFSPERPLRGGAWINPRGTVGNETRASLPPSFCSPFVSFRPVIAPSKNTGSTWSPP